MDDVPYPDEFVRDDVETFLLKAHRDMSRRMEDGVRRGWNSSWIYNYPDGAVRSRLYLAVTDLLDALIDFRTGKDAYGILRIKAADVANQAFMLADPARLTENPQEVT